MEVIKTELDGVLIINPRVFGDSRGHLFETYNKKKFSPLGIKGEFVHEFQSLSSKGALRGLHFQKKPFAQPKLVRVMRGSVLDIVVDIRKESKTYGQWISVELSEKNHKMLWIPEGFAHGFVSLEDNTLMQYKCAGPYDKDSEGGIIWNDPDLKIDWKIENPELSERDKAHPLFRDIGEPF